MVNPSQQQTPSSISPAATDADWFLVTSFVFGAFKTYLVNDVIVWPIASSDFIRIANRIEELMTSFVFGAFKRWVANDVMVPPVRPIACSDFIRIANRIEELMTSFVFGAFKRWVANDVMVPPVRPIACSDFIRIANRIEHIRTGRAWSVTRNADRLPVDESNQCKSSYAGKKERHIVLKWDTRDKAWTHKQGMGAGRSEERGGGGGGVERETRERAISLASESIRSRNSFDVVVLHAGTAAICIMASYWPRVLPSATPFYLYRFFCLRKKILLFCLFFFVHSGSFVLIITISFFSRSIPSTTINSTFIVGSLQKKTSWNWHFSTVTIGSRFTHSLSLSLSFSFFCCRLI